VRENKSDQYKILNFLELLLKNCSLKEGILQNEIKVKVDVSRKNMNKKSKSGCKFFLKIMTGD
jgi:hypothetical protein